VFCPTGVQIRLCADDIEAVVTEVGGGLRSLRAAGRDLIAGFPPDQLCPVYRGAVLGWASTRTRQPGLGGRCVDRVR